MDECKDTNASESELNAGLDLIYGLIFSTGSPEATELVKNNEQFSQIYDYLVELRQIVISFAKGDFTKDVKLTLIPYYAWNHRGAGNMTVWLPEEVNALPPIKTDIK